MVFAPARLIIVDEGVSAHPQTLLVTGGAGFIGSCFVRAELARGTRVVTLDALTYAGNLDNLAEVAAHPAHRFVKGDIRDAALVSELLTAHAPDAVIHCAAESHVDRSILDAAPFVDTNVSGTQRLLAASLRHWSQLPSERAASFRFVHVSTDEVFGSLGPDDAPFSAASPYRPNSPYAASKAAADHFVRAYHHTYGLPTLTTHCSNNYGPYQFPEKLIPLMILNALERRPLPLYGDGKNVRDWLYVEDHCAALALILRAGRPGAVYTIGGRAELENREVVLRVCDLVDRLVPDGGPSRRELVSFVADRPGHDRRYAIDDAALRQELGWAPAESFDSGLEKTIAWYLTHAGWVAGVKSGAYRQWLDTNYGGRPGAPGAPR